MGYVKKAYELINTHPVILVPQIGNLALNIICNVLIMNHATDFTLSVHSPLSMVTSLGSLVVITLVATLVGLIIYAGTGNMIKSAINNNQTSLKDFGTGVKKYLGKIILATLLIIAIMILAVLVICIPGVLLLVLSLWGDGFHGKGHIYPFNTLTIGSIIALAISVLAIIISVVVIGVLTSLWMPAVIMDDEGVISGLSKGFKAAKKNFWTILGIGALYIIISWAVVIGLNLLYGAVNRSTLLDIPAFHYMDVISYAITIILTTVFTAFLFLVYKDTSKEEGNPANLGGI